ncbi:MAG: hypothetical protein HYX27_05115 [Acidobacteria bacterium]|nr:hypothetical protein [Acidobacteriota bacterium]
MKLLSLFFVALTAAHAEKLMGGSVWSNGTLVKFETRLEPGAPPITKHGGGTLTEKHTIKRHVCNFDNHTYFGFDLTMRRLESGKLRLEFAQLTITPAQMTELFPKVTDWKPLALPGDAPALLEVNDGDVVALDLFVNPSTGQKVIEYMTVNDKDKDKSKDKDFKDKIKDKDKIKFL